MAFLILHSCAAPPTRRQALGVVSTLLAFLIALRLLPLGLGVPRRRIHRTDAAPGHGQHPPDDGTAVHQPVAGFGPRHPASRQDPRRRIRHYIAAGLLLGLSCLVRPQLQLLPLLAIVLVLLVRRFRPHLPRCCSRLPASSRSLVPGTCAMRPSSDRKANPTCWSPRSTTARSRTSCIATIRGRSAIRIATIPGRRASPGTCLRRCRHIGSDFAAEPARYLRWYLLGKPGDFPVVGHRRRCRRHLHLPRHPAVPGSNVRSSPVSAP